MSALAIVALSWTLGLSPATAETPQPTLSLTPDQVRRDCPPCPPVSVERQLTAQAPSTTTQQPTSCAANTLQRIDSTTA